MPTAKKKRAEQRTILTRPQWSIYEAGWEPDARFRVAVCGRRFGKTHLAGEEMRRACREAVRNGISTENELWYGAPTLRQARRVFWNRLKKSIPDEWVAKRNESECSITLTSGHIVRIVGMAEYDNLRGSGLYFFLGDEWQDAPEEAWTETIHPMLSTAGGHALFIGTPKGHNHFKDWFDKGQGCEPDTRSFFYTTLQGGNVPPAEVEAAKRMLDARTFRQEYEASFEGYEGRVLFAFSSAPGDNVIPCRDKLKPDSRIHLGIDFNIDPMTCAVLVEEGDVVYQVDEIVLRTSNTDGLVAEVRKRYARGGSLTHITGYPDPAGAQRRTSAGGRTDIGILQASGMRVLAMQSHPLVRDRNNVLNARFCSADGKRRLFVDPSCRHSIMSYDRHVYKEGTSEPDKTSEWGHICDGLGYYAYARHAYKPPQQRVINIMGR